MEKALSLHDATLLRIKLERADLVLRMTRVCSHLTRTAFKQLIDDMMAMREGDLARLALNGAL